MHPNPVNSFIVREKINLVRTHDGFLVEVEVCMTHDEFAIAICDEEERRPGVTEGVVNRQPVRADGSPDYGYHDNGWWRVAYENEQKKIAT